MKVRYIELLAIFVGFFGSIASIIASNKLLIFTFLGIGICGIVAISVLYVRKNYGKMKALLYSRHPGLFAVKDLAEKSDNQDIEIIKLIKNAKYSYKNSTSNITCIIDGEIKGDFCDGLFFTISAASLTSNIKIIGYSLILDQGKKIVDDRFHFVDNSNLDKLLEFDSNYKVISETPYARKLYLPFSTFLERGKKFQAILYYTWKNSIVDLTDSTSYPVSTIFPRGVKKLVTNLVFTSEPFDVVETGYEVESD